MESEASILSIQYKPDNETSIENPPRFMWLPESTEKAYSLVVSKDESFKDIVFKVDDIKWNFYTHYEILECGKYFWKYGIDESFSKVRNFTIDEKSINSTVPFYKTRFSNVEKSHPRLWLNSDEVIDFRKNLKSDKNYVGFENFYERTVKKFIGTKLVAEPSKYPNDVKVIRLWRENYITCQIALNHIRSLSIAGVILEDEKIIAQAKNDLLELSNWDVNGATSRDYNDECSFRVAEALAWGYDWLYNYLSPEEKKSVYKSLFDRTKQVADHVIVNSKIHFSLYDSHAVRSLSSVLTPCSIAMLFEESEIPENWLNYTIDYFYTIYTPWGGIDGGWAEGGMYWTTGMAFLINAVSLINNYTDINLNERAFLQKTGDFPLYCYPHDTYRSSFCDQSNIGKKPGLKTGFNVRNFAGVTNNGYYQWYFENISKRESYDSDDFFDTGWWDFYFDEMLYKFNYGEVLPTEPTNDTFVKHFRDIDWVAIHKNMSNPEEHIFMLTKSSKYGSVSHSHGDQNSLLLHAFSEPLLIESGYYIGFNSSMHRDWRRNTKSQNTLLIDNVGQYDQMNKILQLSATGKVLDVREEEDYIYIKENATNAYKHNVKSIVDYTREIYFVNETYFVIVDYVELSEEKSVNYLLHSLNPFEINGDDFITTGKKAKLKGKIEFISSGIENVSCSSEFDGVDPKEIEGLDKQYHYKLDSKSAKKHIIVSTLLPLKKDDLGEIITIKDDQGHDIYFYFTKDGHNFSIEINNNKRY